MKRRLVLITEIIAPYRIPVFNALAQRDEIDLHVIFLAENDPTLRQWRVDKDEIRFSYRVLPSLRKRLGTQNVLLNWGLNAALRRASPDAILCGGYNYLASWEAMVWARRSHVPFILWFESTLQDQRHGSRSIEFLKRKFVGSCDSFVVPGKSSFEYLSSFGVSEQFIFMAPNAVDVEFFTRQADEVRNDPAKHRQLLNLPSRFFLFVGRLVAEKGVFDLLAAYGTLAPGLRSGIGLVFVGDGPARSEMCERAGTIAPGSVQFTGFAQREQLASYYALAEMLVFPTRTDPWGLVVNEAMACGLPVIASSAAGCVADLLEDDWNGRRVPRGNVGQLASAMSFLAQNANLLKLMGKRGREHILKYSPEACAAGIARAVASSEVVRHG